MIVILIVILILQLRILIHTNERLRVATLLPFANASIIAVQKKKWLTRPTDSRQFHDIERV